MSDSESWKVKGMTYVPALGRDGDKELEGDYSFEMVLPEDDFVAFID